MSTKSQTLMHLSGADQREAPGKADENPNPSHEKGTENSHQNLDSKDQKSIANKLDQASKQEDRQAKAEAAENNKPPTRAAEDHGNKPSRGAQIDEALEAEDQATLRKKGIEP
ncbi:hypothetical protein FA10DRAFT_266999 [Acaromyces ingoldii]|uniref:Uncharacterized protein n=1 Tax=Acaromyces ingoldii TaxID=215250 RepID=A0A316YND2_9BASI|nr:hypothetical protein FA10DRAFT_266999 [Acaromyces ingoldii]PWN90546.1 hypothetical protein FA10DRAFT_266999 [Acaromyces ingoldii]